MSSTSLPRSHFLDVTQRSRSRFLALRDIQKTAGRENSPQLSCVHVLHKTEIRQITRVDSQRRFLAQNSVVTLWQYCFEWLQRCSNIARLCCAKNRRCVSSRVTSPLVVQWRQRNVQKSVMHVQSCCFVNLILLHFSCFGCCRLRRCLCSLLLWNWFLVLDLWSDAKVEQSLFV